MDLLKTCVVTAPKSGTIVYLANPTNPRGYEKIYFHECSGQHRRYMKGGYLFYSMVDALNATAAMLKAKSDTANFIMTEPIMTEPSNYTLVYLPVLYESRNHNPIRYNPKCDIHVMWYRIGMLFHKRSHAVAVAIAMKEIPRLNLEQKKASIDAGLSF